ncbi:hypothetical protein [Silvanigrella aquatica]|uniref:Uncharacterized protein n=1 Tax=Silvanigrella aquatica TaxID=1915309 RepID=A0A1L4D162_9BACT|nr:hypothetical protein [Silvanigrella aquatica]APJ03939.1 hypothetical protein AXG55_08485 [Silvanigrella aquatica]
MSQISQNTIEQKKVEIVNISLNLNKIQTNFLSTMSSFEFLENSVLQFTEAIAKSTASLQKFAKQWQGIPLKNNSNSLNKHAEGKEHSIEIAIFKLSEKMVQGHDKLNQTLQNISGNESSSSENFLKNIFSSYLKGGDTQKNISLAMQGANIDDKKNNEMRSFIEKIANQAGVTHGDASQIVLQTIQKNTQLREENSFENKIKSLEKLIDPAIKLSQVQNLSYKEAQELLAKYHAFTKQGHTENNIDKSIYAFQEQFPNLNQVNREQLAQQTGKVAAGSGIPITDYHAILGKLHSAGVPLTEIAQSMESISLGLLPLNKQQQANIINNKVPVTPQLLTVAQQNLTPKQVAGQEKSLQSLGIDKLQLFSETGQVNMAYFVEKIQQSLQQMPKAAVEKNLNQIMPQKSVESILLLTQGANEQNSFQNIYKQLQVKESEKSLDKAYDTHVNTNEAKWDTLLSQVESLKEKSFNQGIEKVANSGIDHATKLFEKLNSLDGTILTVGASLLAVLSAILAGFAIKKGVSEGFKKIFGKEEKETGSHALFHKSVLIFAKAVNKFSGNSSFKKGKYSLPNKTKSRKIFDKIKSPIKKLPGLRMLSKASGAMGGIKNSFAKKFPKFKNPLNSGGGSKAGSFLSKLKNPLGMVTKILPHLGSIFRVIGNIAKVVLRVVSRLIPGLGWILLIGDVLINHWDTIMSYLPESFQKTINNALNYCKEKLLNLWENTKSFLGFGSKKGEPVALPPKQPAPAVPEISLPQGPVPPKLLANETMPLGKATVPPLMPILPMEAKPLPLGPVVPHSENSLNLNIPKQHEAMPVPHQKLTSVRGKDMSPYQENAKNHIVVDFKNTPKGTAVIAKANHNTKIDCHMGYNNLAYE